MTQIPFSELQLSAEVMQAVADMGFEVASPIQSEAIPYLLQGRDVIGQAQTGTGKTAAFGIPIIEKIDPSDRTVQALVMCPTRELAVQVSEEIKKLAKHKRGLSTTAIYGGDSIERQIRDLKRGVHIVIGTPGRIIDHIERGTLKLDHAKIVVLDEADEMLDMGFREDIESILEETPNERQTVFFSATMSKPILALTSRYQNDPKLVKVVRNELTADNVEQLYYQVKSHTKMEVMCRLIDFYQLKLMLVFCNQKKKVDEVVEQLNLRGYQAEGIHGDLRQSQRTNVMSKFRSGVTNILVATDVAARGIDVEDVDAVINYDIPLDEEYYVHRIGRTGRAGKSGKAFTMVVGAERYRLRDIQTYTKVTINKGVIPSFEDIVGIKKANFIEHVQEVINEGDLELFGDVLENLHHAGYSTEQVVAALAKITLGVQKNEMSDLNLEDDDRRFGGERRGGNDRFQDRRGGDRFGGGGRGNDRDRFQPRDDRRGPAPRDRFDREGRQFKRGGEAGMSRLLINVGKQSHITPSHIVGAIAGETGLPGSIIGHIDLFDKHTYVDVPREHEAAIVRALDGNTIKGRRVNVEVAK
ncbi:MAG: DEAD/DEAH box helicase [Cytophagaceae bacterium]|nr:DEAD/DEAH box helicase [Cytophagaceae bacterium]